ETSQEKEEFETHLATLVILADEAQEESTVQRHPRAAVLQGLDRLLIHHGGISKREVSKLVNFRCACTTIPQAARFPTDPIMNTRNELGKTILGQAGGGCCYKPANGKTLPTTNRCTWCEYSSLTGVA